MKAGSQPVLQVAEPPAAYLTRPPIVVDCSVLGALLFEEPTRDQAAQALAGRTLHAPGLLDTEMASVAIKKQRAGGLTPSADRALADYLEQGIELHRPDLQAQCALAIRYGLSAYDAAYLWLAGFLRAPLATFDAKLANAARVHLANLG